MIAGRPVFLATVCCCFLGTMAAMPVRAQDARQQPAQPASPAGNPAPVAQQQEQPASTPSPDQGEKQEESGGQTRPQNVPSDPWELLKQGLADKNYSQRVLATKSLGLLPGNSQAIQFAEETLQDTSSDVRIAACIALGELNSPGSIPKLKGMFSDKDPAVALAAAGALLKLHDEDGYDVYYAVLTGSEKAGEGLIASQMKTLRDPKKLAELGLTEGVGFLPFGGMGLEAYDIIRKQNSGATRAAAARVLADDKDPATSKALADATTDKSWLVRAAASEAIARRDDPSLLPAVKQAMGDEKDAVRYVAAAAVIRLQTPPPPKPQPKTQKKPKRSGAAKPKS